MSATTGDQARQEPPAESETAAPPQPETVLKPAPDPAAPEAPAEAVPKPLPDQAAPKDAATRPPTAAAPARPPRIYRGELTSALSALGLLALMFLAKWYGVAGTVDPSAARPAISTAEDAWNGLTIVRWIVLLTIVAALGSVVLHASQRSHGTRTDTSRVVFGLGSLTSVLLIYRVLIDLPQASRVIDQKLGAVLGVMCALGIAIGGFESMHEQRILAKAISQHPRHRNRTGGDGAVARQTQAATPGQTNAPTPGQTNASSPGQTNAPGTSG